RRHRMGCIATPGLAPRKPFPPGCTVSPCQPESYCSATQACNPFSRSRRPPSAPPASPAGGEQIGVGPEDFTCWVKRHEYRALDPVSGGSVRFHEVNHTQNLLLLPNAFPGPFEVGSGRT